MTDFEIATLFISGAALLLSIIAAFFAGRANNLNKNMFKRQGIIDLHMAWMDVNEVDPKPKKLIEPALVKAVNALSLTASLWNHDVIEKVILYQSYWPSYKVLYNQIDQIDFVVEGLKKTGQAMLTADIRKAYKEMDDFDTSKTDSTKL